MLGEADAKALPKVMAHLNIKTGVLASLGVDSECPGIASTSGICDRELCF